MILRGATLDYAIEDGRIAAIGPELPATGEEIDARELTILPGLIDVHVHFNEPGRADWEGAATGSQALAAGGGTVFFDMPLNSSPCTTNLAAFQAKQAILERISFTDFGLWGGIVPGNLADLEALADAGAIGFKAFMADSGLPEFPRADDWTLYQGMREAARLGLPVAVHAENHELVIGPRNGTTVRDYLASRPVIAEVEAIHRAALLAQEAGAKLHIVHVSSGRGLAAALEAKARGVNISIETCPHYLYFTEEDMERLGAVAKCAPPLRSAGERNALWAGLLRGEVDIVASDHSPAPPTMKCGDDFFAIWGGIAGIQSTLGVLLAELARRASSMPEEQSGASTLLAAPAVVPALGGVHGPSTFLNGVAALTAENPARRFGLTRKGRLAVGCDADFTLLDLEAGYTVTRESLFQRHGLSPYIGATFRGVVRQTILSGQTIYKDGKILGPPGGRMVKHA